MKVCQPVEKEQGSSNVLHGHFRSAPRYVIFDTETNQYDELGNQQPAMQQKQRGRKAHDLCAPLRSLTNYAVDVAIVGGAGRCVLDKLNNCGIKVYKANSTTLDSNIESLMAGELTELTDKTIRRRYSC